MDTYILTWLIEQIQKNNQTIVTTFKETWKTTGEAILNLSNAIVMQNARIARLEKEIEEIKADMPPDVID